MGVWWSTCPDDGQRHWACEKRLRVALISAKRTPEGGCQGGDWQNKCRGAPACRDLLEICSSMLALLFALFVCSFLCCFLVRFLDVFGCRFGAILGTKLASFSFFFVVLWCCFLFVFFVVLGCDLLVFLEPKLGQTPYMRCFDFVDVILIFQWCLRFGGCYVRFISVVFSLRFWHRFLVIFCSDFGVIPGGFWASRSVILLHWFLASIFDSFLVRFWGHLGRLLGGFWGSKSVILGIEHLMFFACRSKSGSRAAKSGPRPAKRGPRAAKSGPRAAKRGQKHSKSGSRAGLSGWK